MADLVFQMEKFWNAVTNTLIISGIKIVLGIVVPLLLAILIKSGTRERSALVIAEELLLKHGSLTDVGTAELSALKSCAGIGRVKSIRLHAAAELGRRIAFGRCRDKIKITGTVFSNALGDPWVDVKTFTNLTPKNKDKKQ